MRLRGLDLCCKAGGASKGLDRAGLDMTGVDKDPQPRYPFKFIQADALTFDVAGYDFIWASPPCQSYSEMRFAPGAVGAEKLISSFRTRLWPQHVPWVIENVRAARREMINPVTLCGSMFGLSAQGCQLQRHRLFESNFGLVAPCKCAHVSPTIGVYGAHARKRSAKHGGRGTKDVWTGGHRAAASEALGIDWMTLTEMSEAIPPAYAEYIGREAMKFIKEKAP